MENNSLNKDEGILYISYNHDHSSFTIGTEIGFKIYNTFPLSLKKERSKNIK